MLDGEIPAGTTAKDVVLHLLALLDICAGLGVGKVFEFVNPAARAFSIDERATLTNMRAELGGFHRPVRPMTRCTVASANGAHQLRIEPWAMQRRWQHAASLTLDCGTLTPMVARPGDPGNGSRSIRPPNGCGDIAAGGSLQNWARREDPLTHYAAVLLGGSTGPPRWWRCTQLLLQSEPSTCATTAAARLS